MGFVGARWAVIGLAKCRILRVKHFLVWCLRRLPRFGELALNSDPTTKWFKAICTWKDKCGGLRHLRIIFSVKNQRHLCCVGAGIVHRKGKDYFSNVVLIQSMLRIEGILLDRLFLAVLIS